MHSSQQSSIVSRALQMYLAPNVGQTQHLAQSSYSLAKPPSQPMAKARKEKARASTQSVLETCRLRTDARNFKS